MERLYKLGLVCGRFQMFHNGHYRIIQKALALCEQLVIFIGSAQEEGTERNPFSATTRELMIEESFNLSLKDAARVRIIGLDDMTDETDISPEWGRYVLTKFREHCGKKPDIIIYGNDPERENWFAPEDIKDITLHILNRSAVPISATEVRRLMLEDKEWDWRKYVPNGLWKHYKSFRERLLKVYKPKCPVLGKRSPAINDNGRLEDGIVTRKEFYEAIDLIRKDINNIAHSVWKDPNDA